MRDEEDKDEDEEEDVDEDDGSDSRMTGVGHKSAFFCLFLYFLPFPLADGGCGRLGLDFLAVVTGGLLILGERGMSAFVGNSRIQRTMGG